MRRFSVAIGYGAEDLKRLQELGQSRDLRGQEVVLGVHILPELEVDISFEAPFRMKVCGLYATEAASRVEYTVILAV